MSANLIKRVIPVISQQPARLALAIMALITISIGSAFLVSDTPTGLFDDSAIYLIAAEIYSPYNEAASDAFFYSYSDYRHLPPGFPLLLALTGASQAYFQAHVLVLILLVLSLPVMYLLAYRIINHQWLSVLVVLMFLSTPGTWLESLKVSSENLYILISLIILYAADRREREITSIFVFTISLLLCLLILTRTVGWSLLLAFILNNKSYHPATWNSSTGKVIAMLFWKIQMGFVKFQKYI